jgi:hypothetical protein
VADHHGRQTAELDRGLGTPGIFLTAPPVNLDRQLG